MDLGKGAERVLVVQRDGRVELTRLPRDTFELGRQLHGGRTIDAALAGTEAADPEDFGNGVARSLEVVVACGGLGGFCPHSDQLD